jgi:hypothetical protein
MHLFLCRGGKEDKQAGFYANTKKTSQMMGFQKQVTTRAMKTNIIISPASLNIAHLEIHSRLRSILREELDFREYLPCAATHHPSKEPRSLEYSAYPFMADIVLGF